MPPPGRSACSRTCTRSPAAASRRAPASPFGPDPTTTASGVPFMGPSSPDGCGPARSELGEQFVGGAERVGLPRDDGPGERPERGRAVHVAQPLPQAGQGDRLDLPGRPLLAAALTLPRGLQPHPVLLDL